MLERLAILQGEDFSVIQEFLDRCATWDFTYACICKERRLNKIQFCWGSAASPPRPSKIWLNLLVVLSKLGFMLDTKKKLTMLAAVCEQSQRHHDIHLLFRHDDDSEEWLVTIGHRQELDFYHKVRMSDKLSDSQLNQRIVQGIEYVQSCHLQSASTTPQQRT